mgnify:CR=1 FL=1
MFYRIGYLNDNLVLDLSNFVTTSVTDMSSMFQNCSGLTSIDLSNFITRNLNNHKMVKSIYTLYNN